MSSRQRLHWKEADADEWEERGELLIVREYVLISCWMIVALKASNKVS